MEPSAFWGQSLNSADVAKLWSSESARGLCSCAVVKDPDISCGYHLLWPRGRGLGPCPWPHGFSSEHSTSVPRDCPCLTHAMQKMNGSTSQQQFPPAPSDTMATFLFRAFSTSVLLVCSDNSHTWLVSLWEQECGVLFLVYLFPCLLEAIFTKYSTKCGRPGSMCVSGHLLIVCYN